MELPAEGANAIVDEDDMSDREYLQADNEAIGEEHTDRLKRLGLTQEEWEAGYR
jgi:hypothetical protein